MNQDQMNRIIWYLHTKNIAYEARAIGHIIKNMESVSEEKRLKLIAIVLIRANYAAALAKSLSNIKQE